MQTIREVITEAFYKSGIVAFNGNVDQDKYTRGLNLLNDILSWYNIQEKLQPYSTVETFTTTSKNITIGSTGDIVTAKQPASISSVLLTSGSLNYKLINIGYDEFDSLNTGEDDCPQYFTYNRGSTNGTIKILPINDTSYTYVVRLKYEFTEYALSDNLDLPDGYSYLIKTELASNISIDYLQPNVSLASKVLEIKNEIQKNNVSLGQLQLDPNLVG